MIYLAELGVRFTGDPSGFDAANKEVQSGLKGTQKLVTDTAKGFALLRESIVASGGGFASVAEEIAGFSVALRTLRTELAGVNRSLGSSSATGYGEKMARSAEEVGAMGKAAASARRDVDALNSSMARNRAFRPSGNLPTPKGSDGGLMSGAGMYGLSSLGGALSRVGTGILAGAGLSAYLAQGYETSLAKLEEWAGASHKEVQALRPEFMKLGEAVGVFPAKLPDGYFYIRSLGMKGRESLEMLADSAKDSASGLGQMEEITQALTSAKYTFALPVKEINDLVAKSVVLAHADPGAFFKNMGQAMPIAATLKMHLRDMLGIVAIMTREGLSPAKGFQRITAMMDALSRAPTGRQKSAAKMMGLDIGAFRKEMSDNLMGAIEDVEKKSKGKLEVIRDFFGPRKAGDAALSFMNPNAQKANEEVFSQMQHSAGAAENAWKVASDTVAVHWKQAFAAGANAAISFGATLKGEAKDAADRLKSGFDWLQRLPEPVKHATAEIALLGGATMLLGGKLLQLAPGIRAGIQLFSALGPEGALAVGAVVAATGLGIAAMKGNWFGLRDMIKTNLDYVAHTWRQIWPELKEVAIEAWAAIGPSVTAAGNWIVKEIGYAGRKAVDVVHMLVDGWVGGIALIKSTFGNGMEGLKLMAVSAAASIVSTITHMVSDILGVMSKLAPAVGPAGWALSGPIGKASKAVDQYSIGADTMASMAQRQLESLRTHAVLDILHKAKAGKGADPMDALSNWFDHLKSGLSGGGGGNGFDTGNSGIGGRGGKKAEDLMSSVLDKQYELQKALKLGKEPLESDAMAYDLLHHHVDGYSEALKAGNRALAQSILLHAANNLGLQRHIDRLEAMKKTQEEQARQYESRDLIASGGGFIGADSSEVQAIIKRNKDATDEGFKKQIGKVTEWLKKLREAGAESRKLSADLAGSLTEQRAHILGVPLSDDALKAKFVADHPGATDQQQSSFLLGEHLRALSGPLEHVKELQHQWTDELAKASGRMDGYSDSMRNLIAQINELGISDQAYFKDILPAMERYDKAYQKFVQDRQQMKELMNPFGSGIESVFGDVLEKKGRFGRNLRNSMAQAGRENLMNLFKEQVGRLEDWGLGKLGAKAPNKPKDLPTALTGATVAVNSLKTSLDANKASIDALIRQLGGTSPNAASGAGGILGAMVPQVLGTRGGAAAGILGAGLQIASLFKTASTGVQMAKGLSSVPFAFADGGSYQGNQPILVGERGPEILVPRSGGQVIPNHELGGSGETHNHLHVHVHGGGQIDRHSMDQLMAEWDKRAGRSGSRSR